MWVQSNHMTPYKQRIFFCWIQRDVVEGKVKGLMHEDCWLENEEGKETGTSFLQPQPTEFYQ